MPSSTINKATFLQSEVTKSINILHDKVKSQKKKVKVFNGLSISLAALITLVLGLELTDFSLAQKNIALFLGALLTIINSWNAFFDYKKLWSRQKSTLLDLYQINNELGYRLSNEQSPVVDDLFDKYQNVWEKDSNEWRSIIQTKQSPPATQSE